jgi:coenzyme F420-reducing hydrogenase gamma subunit
VARRARPRLAVWKFASRDGCQLSLLDCEDEFVAVAEQLDIAYFAEASRRMMRGPYDFSLVEGSITTPADAERILRVRRLSRHLVTIGACATAGGNQALRNFADMREFAAACLSRPNYLTTLATSTAISAHVPVDFKLRGCPIDKGQLLEVVEAFLIGRKPVIPDHSVCHECKSRGTVCVTVAHGTPCLGPVTQNRVRRDLPRLRSRVLWVLRASREPKYRRHCTPILGIGHDRARYCPGVPNIQCGCRGISQREPVSWRLGQSRSTTSRGSKEKARSTFGSSIAKSMKCG